MVEFLLTLYAQVDTSTVGPDVIGTSLWNIVEGFGLGAVHGFAAVFAFLLVASRFQGVEVSLAETKWDWLVWAARSVAVIGGAVTGALLTEPENVFQAVFGALVASVPVAWVFIQRTVEEIQD